MTRFLTQGSGLRGWDFVVRVFTTFRKVIVVLVVVALKVPETERAVNLSILLGH